jgi:hypothetical protein
MSGPASVTPHAAGSTAWYGPVPQCVSAAPLAAPPGEAHEGVVVGAVYAPEFVVA